MSARSSPADAHRDRPPAALVLDPDGGVRAVRAVPLRPDVGDLPPVVPGPDRRADLPDAGILAALVLGAVRPAAHRRLPGLVPALDRAGSAGDGDHAGRVGRGGTRV